MASTGTGRVGRPREFDTDEALERALEVFWEKGYEGASLSELTGAMGITKTSMYAAFGNKEQLFRKVVERYTAGPASYGMRALEEPTARRVSEALLHGAVRATTRAEVPSGCLGVQSALTTGESGLPAREALIDWRNDARVRLEERFERAQTEGDLPKNQDPHGLAMFVMTVAYGIAVQAASGRSSEELHGVADAALGAIGWPDSETNITHLS
ncbi:TetR/AcrR family transcriptional regulator [Micromonospora sp. WMMD1082]|uniref:TetR/AcrR family transcriptional regulator n=1 Tax=Micromonospora sp. WMMD1082 TaxID=3016104 RepID=UPI00241618CD|nr:TetR/AcrR family transcriptional regulator [Micromonospora sp. WMMD1082]MDG4796672.1 TetR/AcrR family transcriptional regulator [Micromonospora sp. WMMD1082]